MNYVMRFGGHLDCNILNATGTALLAYDMEDVDESIILQPDLNGCHKKYINMPGSTLGAVNYAPYKNQTQNIVADYIPVTKLKRHPDARDKGNVQFYKI